MSFEFDIKGFFDNVNHAKLIRQIWAMGIHDKALIFVLRRILTAQIKLEDGTFITPDKGTPQGGLCGAPHNPPYAERVIMPSQRQNTACFRYLYLFDSA